MTLMWLGLGMAALLLTVVWVTLAIGLHFFRSLVDSTGMQENENFRAVTTHYEKLLEKATAEASAAAKIPLLVEATNLNTKSLDLVEKALNQLVLRTAASGGFVDRTNKQTQVGEETPGARVANRVVIGASPMAPPPPPAPDGFVDETEAGPRAPTPREIAAMPPT